MKQRSKTRRSSSESSSEKQDEMAEDGDEPQDLKILTENPDNPDKTPEMSGRDCSSRRLPQLPDQSAEEKTVNPAPSPSQMFSLHSSETEADFKTKNSPPYFSTSRERPRVNPRTSPSGIDNPYLFHIDNVCGVNIGSQCFFPTGVGHKRNKDSEQQTGSGCLPPPSDVMFFKNYESRFSPIVYSRPNSSELPDYLLQSHSSDIDFNFFSGSRDRLDIKEKRFFDTDYQHTLEDIESPDMSDIDSPVTYQQSWTPWTPDPSERRRKSSCLSHRRSSSRCSSEKQKEMAKDGDEPQDLKILKEDPGNSSKRREMTGGGMSLNKLHKFLFQSSEEKTVNPASSSSQKFSLFDSSSYSSETEADFKTKKSPRLPEKQKEMAKDGDEPQDLKILKEDPDNSSKRHEMTGGGMSFERSRQHCLKFPSFKPSGSSSMVDFSTLISNELSDSTDLDFRYQTGSCDLNIFSGSRDRLDIEADYQTMLEDMRKSSCLSHSSSSLDQIISTENTNLNRAASLPNMKLKSSFEEFTPDFTDEDKEDGSYRFQCSGPGLYLCRETGLVFDMVAEGDVFYRTVPWNRMSLSQHHRKPAGPLFDISCEQQQSVCRLHLPHCETPSTGRCHFLSVAHINDDGVAFISPARITETHVIINITGFSAFGNVKDEDSPPDPVSALVLLFYKPPVDPDPEYRINVLMLPKNVVVREVLRFRKQLDGGEMFLETPPHCKLLPKQVYTLSTAPGDDSVLVQPTEAEFDEESYDNYFTAFQVTYEKLMKHIKLFLKDSSSSSVWERRVCLSSSGLKRSCGSTRQNLCPKDQLEEIRISFIDGISEPVLKYLVDKLLQKNVIHDAEKEAILVERERRDKARAVIDTVRKKGDSASSEMITCLCELDPFFCEHLGLK